VEIFNMANPTYQTLEERKKLISDIKSEENIRRKRRSLRDYEVYNDNAYNHVKLLLESQLSPETAKKMPIISNINISKAVVTKEANIYLDEPARTYEDISKTDQEVLEKVYKECAYNSVLGKANKYYKLRNQCFLQIVPKYGKLKIRVLQPHNIDVVPDEMDPETAYAYVISTFDKDQMPSYVSDRVNQSIADKDDAKALAERYQVTTAEFSFVINGKGDYVVPPIPNIIGMLPFVDIAKDKDFEFMVKIGQALTEFTIDFNAAYSDLMYVCRMQGFSLGVLSGDAKLKPETMTIGPAELIFLPSSPDNPDSKLSLDFKSPTPNIEASLKAIESLIGLFLSTRGIDIKAIQVNGSGQAYSSALEKLLSMIDQFKATKEDFDLFGNYVEKQIHTIVTKYLAELTGSEFLSPEYNVSQAIVKSKLTVKFKEPEMVETTKDKLENGKSKIDLGISDRVLLLSELEGLSTEAAQEKIDEIDERRADYLQTIRDAGVNSGDTENQQQT
jgi:hypothetical protein